MHVRRLFIHRLFVNTNLVARSHVIMVKLLDAHRMLVFLRFVTNAYLPTRSDFMIGKLLDASL